MNDIYLLTESGGLDREVYDSRSYVDYQQRKAVTDRMLKIKDELDENFSLCMRQDGSTLL